MVRFRGPQARSEWLGLGEASRLLGVAPGTLRRWSDDGRVSAFTTPGGHRRYRRTALERLIPGERVARPSVARSGVTGSRLARAYRREAQAAARSMPWLDGLTEEQRAWFRSHGRELATELVTYVDADNDEVARLSLNTAAQQAAAYGRMAAGLGLSLGQTVEGFLQFRRPFLHQLGLFSGRRGLDATDTHELIEKAESAMDRLLLSAMTGHGVERVVERRNRDGQPPLMAE